MVVAHAVVSAERGNDVLVLIDDGAGRAIASKEAARLKRLRSAEPSVGSLRLVSTLSVLENAAGREHLPDRRSMRILYERLRGLDDGLPPLESTGLMGLEVWG